MLSIIPQPRRRKSRRGRSVKRVSRARGRARGRGRSVRRVSRGRGRGRSVKRRRGRSVKRRRGRGRSTRKRHMKGGMEVENPMHKKTEAEAAEAEEVDQTVVSKQNLAEIDTTSSTQEAEDKQALAEAISSITQVEVWRQQQKEHFDKLQEFLKNRMLRVKFENEESWARVMEGLTPEEQEAAKNLF